MPWNIIEKKNLTTLELKPASPVSVIDSQQTCYALDHHASPKKDASSPKLSNIVFSHSSNVKNKGIVSKFWNFLYYWSNLTEILTQYVKLKKKH